MGFFFICFLNCENYGSKMLFLFLLNALYKCCLQLDSKYLLIQYTRSCNPIPSFLFILRKVLAIHIIKNCKLVAGYKDGHSHCDSFQVLWKAICLVVNISSQNLSLHMTLLFNKTPTVISFSPSTIQEKTEFTKGSQCEITVLC